MEIFYSSDAKSGQDGCRKRCWYSSNDTGTQFFTNSVVEELLLGLPKRKRFLKKAKRNPETMLTFTDIRTHILPFYQEGQKQRLSSPAGFCPARISFCFGRA